MSGSTSPPITRRELLAAGGASLGAAALGVTAGEPPRRVLRFAHLTDVHVQPERGGEVGLSAALRHAQTLGDPPTFIMTGGDAIMDAFAADAERTRIQWDGWQRILAGECGVPVAHCIGNHDIWGWNRARSGATGKEAKWGKAWACDAFGLAQRYHAFSRAGWRFIVLDSTQPHGDGGYTAHLDDAQWDWLVRELRDLDAATPVVVVSHIPILTVTGHVYDEKRVADHEWRIPGSWVHTDAHRLKQLFLKHPNVKLCLSGHMHLLDRCDHAGVTYICDGAVCGGWWQGDCQECDEGYGVVDLYDDGSFAHEYVSYGWTPR